MGFASDNATDDAQGSPRKGKKTVGEHWHGEQCQATYLPTRRAVCECQGGMEAQQLLGAPPLPSCVLGSPHGLGASSSVGGI